MATKALPAGDADVLLAVYNAISHDFLRRLLIPLQGEQVRL